MPWDNITQNTIRIKNCKPPLEVSILDIQQHTAKRKLSEAIHIHKNKPNLNDKSELEDIVKYIT